MFRTESVRNGLFETMADNKLDPLVYPTTTYTAAELGQNQRVGSNNRLSAFSGFPAMTLPAGYTSNNLPVGIEFLVDLLWNQN